MEYLVGVVRCDGCERPILVTWNPRTLVTTTAHFTREGVQQFQNEDIEMFIKPWREADALAAAASFGRRQHD